MLATANYRLSANRENWTFSIIDDEKSVPLELPVQTNTSVIIFGADAYPILGAVRSLGRRGIPVYCIDKKIAGIAARSRYCKRCFAVDFNALSDKELLDALEAIALPFDTKPLLIPTYDHIVLFIDRHHEKLEQLFTLPAPRSGSAALLHNKQSLQQLAEQSAIIKMPRSHFPASVTEFLDLADTVGYPIFVKPKDPSTFRIPAGNRLFYFLDRVGMKNTLQSLSKENIGNLFLQVPSGGPAGISIVASAYVDKRGAVAFLLCGRKDRQLPVHGGITSRGTFFDCPPVRDVVSELARLSGYRGILDLDFRLDQASGELTLLDVNPRLGANFRLMTGLNGVDALQACYLDLTGQNIPPALPDSKRTWMTEEIDFDAVRDMQMPPSTAALQWIADLFRTSEKGYLSLDDPRPSIIFMIRFGQRLFRNALRRLLRRNADDQSRAKYR